MNLAYTIKEAINMSRIAMERDIMNRKIISVSKKRTNYDTFTIL